MPAPLIVAIAVMDTHIDPELSTLLPTEYPLLPTEFSRLLLPLYMQKFMNVGYINMFLEVYHEL